MKRLVVFGLLVVLATLKLSAQAPKGINYQGVARDHEGKAIVSKKIAVRISILKNSADGDAEYKEIHEVTTNTFGLFTLVIGQGKVNSGSFDFISWAMGSKWLQIELDPNGLNSFQLIGSQQLMSVPYALYAQYSGNGLTAGQGIAIANGVVSNSGDSDNSTTNELNTSLVLSADHKLKITDAGGTKEADLSSLLGSSQNLSNVLTAGNDAGGQKITNLAAPVLPSDAATKVYVDSHQDGDANSTNEIQNINQVLIQGSDAGGLKLMNLGTPTAPADATTKLYVDNLDTADGDKSSTNELQNLSQVLSVSNDAGSRKIQNVIDPTSSLDVANKQYVDAADDVLRTSISTTYAFKVNFGFTAAAAGSNILVVLGTEDIDNFNVINSNVFTAPQAGVYLFHISATAGLGGPPLKLRINSASFITIKRVPTYPNVSIPHYIDTVMLRLNANDTVDLVTDVLLGENFNGVFFGYKL